MHDLEDRGHWAVPLKRMVIRYKLVEDNTHREDICSVVGRPKFKLLRGHVAQRTHGVAGANQGLARSVGDRKVGYSDHPIVAKHDAGGLDTVVRNSALM